MICFLYIGTSFGYSSLRLDVTKARDFEVSFQDFFFTLLSMDFQSAYRLTIFRQYLLFWTASGPYLEQIFKTGVPLGIIPQHKLWSLLMRPQFYASHDTDVRELDLRWSGPHPQSRSRPDLLFMVMKGKSGLPS